MKCSDCGISLYPKYNLSDSSISNNWSYCEIENCKNGFCDSWERPHSYTDSIGRIVCKKHKLKEK